MSGTFTVAWDAAGEDLRDADGIPIWYRDEAGAWACGSQREQLFAVDCAPWLCLAELDHWLSALPDCPLKIELLRRRAQAWKATQEDNHDALLRHLEFMVDRKREHTREHALLPLARAGHGHRQAQRKRAQQPRTPREVQKCIDAAKRLPGTAKEQWGRLSVLLEQEGFIVRDAATAAGNPTLIVEVDGRSFSYALKTFQNKKSR